MSPNKYQEYSKRKERKREIHPIWRGIGFIIMVLIPVMSYAAVDVLLKQNGINNWFPLPRDLIAVPGQFLYNLVPDPMINIKIILFLVFMFLFYILFTFIGMLITTAAVGRPEKRDPYYVPPVVPQRRRRP